MTKNYIITCSVILLIALSWIPQKTFYYSWTGVWIWEYFSRDYYAYINYYHYCTQIILAFVIMVCIKLSSLRFFDE